MDPRSSYREAAAQCGSAVRLVILLYEQAIEDLRRALAAHARRDIEGRTREIKHAILVIGHLQSSLDKERGGKVAANLEDFYTMVRASLVKAQCEQPHEALETQISLLMQVLEAWCVVERFEAAPGVAIAAAEPAQPRAEGEQHSYAEWKA
jgi:flagellar secretion chaperone FliS